MCFKRGGPPRGVETSEKFINFAREGLYRGEKCKNVFREVSISARFHRARAIRESFAANTLRASKRTRKTSHEAQDFVFRAFGKRGNSMIFDHPVGY